MPTVQTINLVIHEPNSSLIEALNGITTDRAKAEELAIATMQAKSLIRAVGIILKDVSKSTGIAAEMLFAVTMNNDPGKGEGQVFTYTDSLNVSDAAVGAHARYIAAKLTESIQQLNDEQPTAH